MVPRCRLAAAIGLTVVAAPLARLPSMGARSKHSCRHKPQWSSPAHHLWLRWYLRPSQRRTSTLHGASGTVVTGPPCRSHVAAAATAKAARLADQSSIEVGQRLRIPQHRCGATAGAATSRNIWSAAAVLHAPQCRATRCPPHSFLVAQRDSILVCRQCHVANGSTVGLTCLHCMRVA
jgi:hypothetical protein